MYNLCYVGITGRKRAWALVNGGVDMFDSWKQMQRAPKRFSKFERSLPWNDHLLYLSLGGHYFAESVDILCVAAHLLLEMLLTMMNRERY
ncbi:hypothetical protein QQP08_002415 [Theobroma cacao]|nr:hypothetical protein QQP08_002415 [Theobroma cacao]